MGEQGLLGFFDRDFHTGFCAAACAAALLVVAPGGSAEAQSFLDDWRIEGSLGEGGFSRYVPPVSNPIFNETPLITTEIRPIYFHQKIPGDFLTNGGDIDVAAIQARLAITERFGLIATTDGYAWANFKQALPDSKGLADLGLGAKYAVHYDPMAGEIITLGARYTIPVGTLDVGAIDLAGYGDGYVHGFVSGMKIIDDLQLQGNIGFQQAVSGKNTSTFYASAHASYEVMDGLYPLIEFNAFVPYDGGNTMRNSKLTGFEVADFGSSDPKNTFTVAPGLRWRAHDNAILGAAFEYNLNEDKNTLFQWRAMVDMAIHF